MEEQIGTIETRNTGGQKVLLKIVQEYETVGGTPDIRFEQKIPTVKRVETIDGKLVDFQKGRPVCTIVESGEILKVIEWNIIK